MNIFIGGTGRCGTSVIGRFFIAHPDTVFFTEPRFISDCLGLVDFIKESISADIFRTVMLRYFREMMLRKLKQTYDDDVIEELYSVESMQKLVNETVMQNGQSKEIRARAFIDGLFGKLVKHEGALYWVEKTPHTVKYTDILYRLYGEALRYIHVIRDPADVCASMLKQDWGPSKVGQFPAYYNELMETAWFAKRKVPHECYLTVRLETLVSRPKDTIRRIFEFCEIDITDDWLADAALRLVDRGKAHIGRAMEDLTVPDHMYVCEQCAQWYWSWRLVI